MFSQVAASVTNARNVLHVKPQHKKEHTHTHLTIIGKSARAKGIAQSCEPSTRVMGLVLVSVH